MKFLRRFTGARLYFLMATVLFAATSLPVTAVDNLGIFQLDGNATQDGETVRDDWQRLHNGGGNSVAFTGIIADPVGETLFTGGRKDIHDISKWSWKNGSGVPDKDEITNAYAAAYVCPETTDNCSPGDLIVYFGADRYSNTGDAFMGFWFFKDRVGANDDGSFSGVHKVGDVLVLINYPQGANAVPEIQVIEWNPALADVGTNLHLLYSSTANGINPRCGDGASTDACAITNESDAIAPWPYTPKSGTPGIFPYESFFEGGINLTKILGGAACFSSFMSETRSSTSITATLKDFALGEFPVCNISVSKSCDVVRLTNSGDSTDKYFLTSFDAMVTNTGAGTFGTGETLTLVDDAGTPNDSSDDVIIQQPLSQPFKPGDVLNFTGTFFTNDNPPYNTVNASVTFGEANITAKPFSTECTALQLNPALSATKGCDTALQTSNNTVTVRVDYSGQVCNDGDVPLTVDVVDDKAGLVVNQVLIQPGSCLPINGSYTPTEANGGETCPGNAAFSDTFTVTGTSPVLSEPVTAIVTATCPLCTDCTTP